MAEENKSVTPWKPEDAVAQLKERIRLEFASMIPAEQFAEMVRAVITEFTEKKERNTNYRFHQSDFESVVVNELTEATKEEVRKFLQTPEWQGRWSTDGTGQKEASEAIGALMQERGPKILSAWLGSAMQQAVEMMLRR